MMFELMTIAITILIISPFAIIAWFIVAMAVGGVKTLKARRDEFRRYTQKACNEPLATDVEIATTGRNAIFEEKDENGILI